MKTAEEVLKEKFYMVWTYQDFDSFGPKVCEIMEQFASEQNAQLRKQLELCNTDCFQNEAEVNELRKRIPPYVDVYVDNLIETRDALRKENEELRLKALYSGPVQEKMAELSTQNQELRIQLQEAKTSEGRGWKAYERVRIEYEEGAKEYTRLTELLRRANNVISSVTHEELKKEIENAIGHED